MRLFALTTLTMVAFAANSVLNRLALEGGDTGPAAFAAIRLGTGAVALTLMVLARSGGVRLWTRNRPAGAATLALYVLGFSFAYVSLDAGLGALILFGVVQMTMFAGALISGERPSRVRMLGAAISLAGLAWLLWPTGATAPAGLGAVLMAAAGVGWGLYSLIGRGASDPLAETAANFLVAAPVAILISGLVWDGAGVSGFALATVSGVVTSGLGYALWYRVLPQIDASAAAIAQLSVPVIAFAGGALLLGEVLTGRFLGASVLVLGGLALGVLWRRPQRSIGSSAS